MKAFLISGAICVPIYLIALSFSDTFTCGAIAGIVCTAIDHVVRP